jgi:hypothetical protein
MKKIVDSIAFYLFIYWKAAIFFIFLEFEILFFYSMFRIMFLFNFFLKPYKRCNFYMNLMYLNIILKLKLK